jgi:hypothetical protein
MDKLIAVMRASVPPETTEHRYHLTWQFDYFPGTTVLRWFRCEVVTEQKKGWRP